jgi:3-hydroxyisobutyrate dehydrogenase-like beta-hydroxyacid dehydrogenase
MPVLAVIAPGQMGAAVARRVAGHGARVVTSLIGRGPASVERARAAGMVPVADAEIAEADMILSIVPPAEAEALAVRFVPFLNRATRKPLYVDCNAVSPGTVQRIAGTVEPTGCGFVDVGIIGPPPAEAATRTVFYASGEAAPGFALLRDFGLDVRILAGPVGAASALKMSYAGITKGLTALGGAMMLAAGDAGLAEALAAELLESQPALAAWLRRQVPRMYDKAYRWVAEMQEIAAFAGGETGVIYDGAAHWYAAMARDAAGANISSTALDDFVRRLG